MRQRIILVLALCLMCSLLPGSPSIVRAVQATCGDTGTPGATAATGTPSAIEAGQRVELEGGSALLWPGGDRAVLLLHGAAYDAASWEAQAQTLASQEFTVLALEELSAGTVQGGIGYLTDACAARGVTVIGASAGGASALDALADGSDDVSGLILLSATGEVSALGEYPKLFVASEGEGLSDQLETMADSAPGDQNETLILPGSAHAQAMFKDEQGDALVEAIVTFLNDTATWDA